MRTALLTAPGVTPQRLQLFFFFFQIEEEEEQEERRREREKAGRQEGPQARDQ